MIRLITSEERITFTLYVRQLNRVFDELTELYKKRTCKNCNQEAVESQIKYYQDEKHIIQHLMRKCLVQAQKTEKQDPF